MNSNALLHLYFDWNIFKYIKTPRNKNDESFAKLIDSIKDYVLIAYSPFHISGLIKNYDNSKYDYIVKDCELISKITNNLCISKIGDKIQLDYRDPLQMFNDQIETESMMKEIQESGNIFDLMTIDQKKDFERNFYTIKYDETLKNIDDPFIEAILQSNDPKEAMKQIILTQNKFQNEPETYSKVRSNLVSYKDKYFELTEPEKELLNLKIKDMGIEKDFLELDDKEFIIIAKNNLNGIEDTEISNSYTFKDLFGITKPEKMTSKNTFKNIIDDSFHLDFARYALYYITEDKANLDKAGKVKNELNLKMEIFNIENALNYIGVNLYTKEPQNNDN